MNRHKPHIMKVVRIFSSCFHRDVGAAWYLDRSMTTEEVEAAITNYVNSVKARAQKK